MSSPKIQSNVDNIGNGGSGSVSFTGAQTLGNTNVIFIMQINGTPATTNITSIFDTSGNTYTKQAFATSANGAQAAGIWAYTCTNIAAHGAGNAVSITWADGNFMDMCIIEYPATNGVRVANGNSQFGGTAIVPKVTLTGTSNNDLVVAAGENENFNFTIAGSVGANTANLVANDSPNSDSWIAQDGLSDGTSPLNVTFGTTTNDWYCIVAVAFIPVSANVSIPTYSKYITA